MQFALGILIHSQECQKITSSNLSTLSNLVSLSTVYVQFKNLSNIIVLFCNEKIKKAMQFKKKAIYTQWIKASEVILLIEKNTNQTDPQENKSNFWFFDKRRRPQYPGKNPQSKVGNHQT